MPTQEKQLVIKAINDLGRKVSIADVATKTGLPLLLTTNELNKVAAETGGHLLVSTAGDIAYQFNPGFQNSYLAHGIRRILGNFTEQTLRIGFFILRISFGIMLILSLLTIVVIIGMIMLYLNRDNDREDNLGFNFDLFDFLVLRDLFYWTAYSSSADTSSKGYQRPVRRTNGNFLLNCFSFLFGDGDPNAHLNEHRWQLIGQAINVHGGVITSEQLAPYIGDGKSEDAVLPVLVRFDGRPEVSESGNIIYVFPSLQVSALGTSDNPSSSLPSFLKELPHQFSQVDDEALIPVVILAAINFFGSWWILFESTRIAILADLAPLIMLLVLYGTLFISLPLIRLLKIAIINKRIAERNDKRKELAQILRDPGPALRKKLEESRQFVIEKRQINAADVVYRTDEDLLSQEFGH
jgi:hypothetical protein